MVDFPPCYLDSLESVLNTLLPEKLNTCGKSKVIHDAVWGSRLFFPWEIAILDTRLCQRLRGIHQLGAAFQTYPSAVHNRFSHTLGVISLADRLLTRLSEQVQVLGQDITISIRDRNTVRLAGLLHDIGHCFFSHTSEHIINPLIRIQKRDLGLGNAKTHEFLSYLIIRHPRFNRFWENCIKDLFSKEEEIPDLDEIANIIVGIPPSNERKFLQEIISGPYDVDKLEYLYRDAKMAGLEIGYDIERYFYKIQIFTQKDEETQDEINRLVMDLGGIRVVEQIIFSKMMLFSFLYHHQKVLATDCLIHDLIVEILNNPTDSLINLDNPLDLLKYNDFDILSPAMHGPSTLYNKIKEDLLSRRLPKRCLVINRSFVKDLENPDIKRAYSEFQKLARGLPDDVESIRQEVTDILSQSIRGVSKNSIFINMPKLPPIDEAIVAPVLDLNGQLDTMSNYFDLQGWQKTYDLKKLCGYFFSDDSIVSEVQKSASEYLMKKYNIVLTEGAHEQAKIR